mgnify:FL=1
MDKIVEVLRRHEGVRSYAYKCSAGYITIGVGRNIDEDGGLGLSDDEVDYLLSNDIDRCIKELGASFDWFKQLDEVRRDAMINLVFNLGMPRLKQFKNTLAAMENCDWNTAADELLDSRWATQVGARATEVSTMIRTGEYV